METQENNSTYAEAVSKVKSLKRFYIKIIVYCAAVILYFLKNYTEAPLNFWPLNWLTETVLLIWSFIMGLEVLDFIFKNYIFSTKWEEKKIKTLLNKEVKNQNWK